MDEKILKRDRENERSVNRLKYEFRHKAEKTEFIYKDQKSAEKTGFQRGAKNMTVGA